MKKNPQAAIDELTSLIESQPQHPAHYVNRAFAWTQLQKYAEAANDFDRALELDKENEEIFLLRGIFHMNCQKRELALADFQQVLALVGDHDLARESRAALLLQMRRYEEAIDDFARLIAKHPDHKSAYSGRAFAFAALGNNEQAQADADRLAAMAPELGESAQKYTLSAQVYRHVDAEDYDTALDVAEGIVTDFPDESFAYRLRAYVHWQREELVESNDDYTRVVELDGPTASCLSARGQVRAELGEWEQALEDLNQAIDLARQEGQSLVLAYALSGRSLVWSGLEREQEAETDYQESISLCSTNPWAYYHRGMRLLQTERWNEAKIMLELAQEFNEPSLSKRKKQRIKVALEKIAKQAQ